MPILTDVESTILMPVLSPVLAPLTAVSLSAGPEFVSGAPSGPAAASGLTATANGSDTIDLAWTDNSDNETGFRVERSPNGTDSWVTVTTTAADATSYSNTGLSLETTYHYRVIAVNDDGEAAASNVDSATTAGLTSAFEDSVMALSPKAAYLFRDTDFSTQVTDSSGNGYHLLKQIAEAVRGASLRPSHHPGGISITNPANFSVNGNLYRNAAGGLDALVGGATSMSIVVGIRLQSGVYGSKAAMFSVGNDGTTDSGSNHITCMIDSSPSIWFKERHPGGLWFADDTSPVFNEPVIYTNRFSYASGPGRLLDRGRASDDTERAYTAGNIGGGSFEDVARSTFIGGRASTGTTGFRPYVMDHLSVFIPALSAAQMDALRAAYRAEL